VLSTTFNNSRVTIHCRIPQEYLGRIDDADTKIQPHAQSGDAECSPQPEEDATTDSMGDVA